MKAPFLVLPVLLAIACGAASCPGAPPASPPAPGSGGVAAVDPGPPCGDAACSGPAQGEKHPVMSRIKAHAAQFGDRLVELPHATLDLVERVNDWPPVVVLTTTAGVVGYVLGHCPCCH